MNTLETVITCIERVTGISAEELKSNEDINLVEEGVLDSLAVVSLISMLQKELGIKLETSDFSLEDFVSAKNIAKVIDNCKS